MIDKKNCNEDIPDISKENLSLGEFLTKNLDDYHLCIVIKQYYVCENDWGGCFDGSVGEFMKDTSEMCESFREHKNFDFEFVDYKTLVITIFDYYL